MLRRLVVLAGAGLVLAVPVAPAPVRAVEGADGTETGLAAVYNVKLDGHKTASGERYDKDQLTTAHRKLPFGAKVKVTRVDDGRNVVLRVNDRGPRHAGRVVDISTAAAKAIGLGANRMTEVKVEVAEAAPAR